MAAAGTMNAYLRLIRFDRPIGTFLLLWPTWWGLWLAAGGLPSAPNLLIFTFGVFLMRSAGCVVNDFADREMDGHVARTRDRPLASGAIRPAAALAFAAVLALAAFALVLQTNALTIGLSFAGLAFACLYPFLKRVTHLPQIGLGIAFSWGIPMAFAAERGVLPAPLWLMFLAALLWSVVYDTFYAMVDRDDDIKIGIRSTAILFGESDRQVTGVLQAMVILLLVLGGRQFGMQAAYYAGIAVAAGLFGWQQWLLRERSREACFRAFLHNNLVGLVVFIAIALDFQLR